MCMCGHTAVKQNVWCKVNLSVVSYPAGNFGLYTRVNVIAKKSWGVCAYVGVCFGVGC
jgi:hypothetical protein